MDIEMAFKHIENKDRRNKHLERKIRAINPERSAQEVDAAIGLLMLRYQPSPQTLITPTEQISAINGLAGNKITNMLPPKKHGTFIISGRASRAVASKNLNNININTVNNNATNGTSNAKIPDKLEMPTTSKRAQSKGRSQSLLSACRDILKDFLNTEDRNQKRD